MELRATIQIKGPILEGKAPQIVHDELVAMLHEAVMYLERAVKEGTPEGVFGEAGGGLRATIHGEVLNLGAAATYGIVGHQSVYGDVIEFGRRSGQAWPPPGSLVRWIEVKMGVDRKTAERLEFVVRRKIGQKGFEGRHMFEKAIKAPGALDRIVEAHGFELARRLDG